MYKKRKILKISIISIIFVILVFTGIFSIGFTANEDLFIIKYSFSMGIIISGLILFFMFKNKLILKKFKFIGIVIFLLIPFYFIFSFLIFNKAIPFLLHKTNFSEEVILEFEIQEKEIRRHSRCIKLSGIKINNLLYCFSNYEKDIYNNIKIGDKVFIRGKISKYGFSNFKLEKIIL
jgi:hypothetical protein